MKNLKYALVIIAAAMGGTLVLAAQPQRVSPQETVTATIDGDELKIVYSRPYTKDPKTGEPRQVWGKLVPYGKVWRTGANEATLFTTTLPIKLGGTSVPAGTYSLFTLPAEDGTAKLIINKQTGQWGTRYDQKQDLARVDLKKETLEKAVDQFTMAIEPNPAGGGAIQMRWETTQYSVAFTVEK